jgi:hypothetical protein
MLSCASSQALNAALKLTVSGRTPLEVSILSDHSAVCSHLALQASSNTSTPGQTHYTHYGSFRGEPYLWIGLDYLRFGLDVSQLATLSYHTYIKLYIKN